MILLLASNYPEFAEPLVEWVRYNVEWAPYVICGLLLLAGLNIPVSEDLMIFGTAVLASKHPEWFFELFVGLFIGAFFSDVICYGLGRFFGNKIWKVKFLAKMITPERLSKVQGYFEKHGALTLFFGRFIPFGVRNSLFLTAGIGKMHFLRFAIYDFIACMISVVTFFTLYVYYGQKMLDLVLKNNKYIFLFAVVIVGLLVLKNRRKKVRKDSSF